MRGKKLVNCERPILMHDERHVKGMNYFDLPQTSEILEYLTVKDLFIQRCVCRKGRQLAFRCIRSILLDFNTMNSISDTAWEILMSELGSLTSIACELPKKAFETAEGRIKDVLRLLRSNSCRLRSLSVNTEEPNSKIEELLLQISYPELRRLHCSHISGANLPTLIASCARIHLLLSPVPLHSPSLLDDQPPLTPLPMTMTGPAPVRVDIGDVSEWSLDSVLEVSSLLAENNIDLSIASWTHPPNELWMAMPRVMQQPRVRSLLTHLAPSLRLVDKMPVLALLQSSAQSEVLRLLVRAGTPLDTADKDGWTALHWAAREDFKSSAMTLVALGANINAVTHSGYTPLIVAAYRGHVNFVQWLAEAGADVNKVDQDGDAVLNVAASKGLEMEDVVIALVRKYGADPRAYNLKRQTALIYAGFFGMQAACEALVQCGADVDWSDADGNTALLLAAKRAGGSRAALDTALTLLNLGADPNKGSEVNGHTPLIVAVAVRAESLALRLLELGADVAPQDTDGDSALLLAVKTRQTRVARAVLQAGADVNVVNVHGETPLDMALYTTSDELAIAMLEHGARLDTRDKDGDTPLLLAIAQCMPRVAHAILDCPPGRGLDVEAANRRGHTALLAAAYHRMPTVCHAVLDRWGRDSDVEAHGEDGETALTVATARDLPDVALRLLREFHACPMPEAGGQRNSLCDAVAKGFWELAQEIARRLTPGMVERLRPYSLSLLTKAIEAGQGDTAVLLLDKGLPLPRMSIPVAPTDRPSLLVAAAAKGLTPLVERLARALPPAFLDAPCPATQGLTPLRAALTHGHEETAIALLEAGVRTDGLADMASPALLSLLEEASRATSFANQTYWMPKLLLPPREPKSARLSSGERSPCPASATLAPLASPIPKVMEQEEPQTPWMLPRAREFPARIPIWIAQHARKRAIDERQRAPSASLAAHAVAEEQMQQLDPNASFDPLPIRPSATNSLRPSATNSMSSTHSR